MFTLTSCDIAESEVLRNVQGTPLPPIPTLKANQVIEGRQLYEAYCASCHGVNGVGTPGWEIPDAEGNFPPPPHNDDGHTWHHPDRVLFESIRNGLRDPTRPNSTLRMPAFRDKLNDTQIRAIMSYFKSLWSKEHRAYQWEINLIDVERYPTITP